jgi:hypothetical protein
MPTSVYDKALLRQAMDAFNNAIRAGYKYPGKPSALNAGAAAIGLHAHTFRSRVLKAMEMGSLVDDPPPEPPPIIETIAKPRVIIKAASGSDAPIYRVVGIGDVHAKPGRSTEHLTWAGRHAAKTKPDRIISIGDWLSLDSCSMHPAKGSYKDHDRPSFSQDIEAGEESLEAFDKECPGDQIPRDITLGNHEERAWTRANLDPKIADDFPLRVEQTFLRYRWKTHRFGEMFYYGGVGFTHVPIGATGRPYGGKHSENTIGNDATHSLVWGHDHRYRFKTLGKIGPNNKISLCNLGTLMPYGVIEDYSVGTTGWSYGLVDLRIQAGLIVSAKFVDVRELSEMYGD